MVEHNYALMIIILILGDDWMVPYVVINLTRADPVLKQEGRGEVSYMNRKTISIDCTVLF